MHVRSVVYSLDPSTQTITNLNEEVLLLDGFVSYSISEYIEDLASAGVALVKEVGGAYLFSDGHTEVLTQQIEREGRSVLGMVA